MAELDISTELVDARDGRQLWGSKYSRPVGEVQSVENEITAPVRKTRVGNQASEAVRVARPAIRSAVPSSPRTLPSIHAATRMKMGRTMAPTPLPNARTAPAHPPRPACQAEPRLGCGACHAPEAPDETDPSLAPSLADVGAKWPEARLRQFISSPIDLHPERPLLLVE